MVKMKYQELRQKIQEWPKYEGCIKVNRSPLINPGFPGTFNLSFTEDPWLKEYGKYGDFDHDYSFSTIQSCIRSNDIPLIAGENSWKYLGVFEMGDLTGSLTFAEKPDIHEIHKLQIKKLVGCLLFLGISLERIFPSYNVGGALAEITKNKYKFGFQVPTDKISRDAFLEIGIPEKNLIKDKTRDTLLSLFLHRPTPWGYRNEINVNIGTNKKPLLLDIGTLEYTMWEPTFSSNDTRYENINGIKNGSFSSINALGLERLNMAVNDLSRIQDVDYIKPFYDELNNTNYLAGESLRALHRIYSDINAYDCKPGRHQKSKISNMLHNIPLDISLEKIKHSLEAHTSTQPWHSELKDGIEPTIERIKVNRSSK